MFTWRHIVWLLICLAMVLIILYFYEKKKPPLAKVLTSACVVCILSETVKTFSMIELVHSAGDAMLRPYIPMNHMPLHFCSFQIILILFVKITENEKLRENVLAFMCPTCIIGSAAALAMPSVFTTTLPVEKAFIAPMAYQFFIYHAMLMVLGIIILRSDEIRWRMKHLFSTVIGVWGLGFISLYVNSMLAAPTYRDGELISVDFWPNFFFTYNAPVNIALTEKWQWCVYILVLIGLSAGLIALFYKLFIFKKISR